MCLLRRQWLIGQWGSSVEFFSGQEYWGCLAVSFMLEVVGFFDLWFIHPFVIFFTVLFLIPMKGCGMFSGSGKFQKPRRSNQLCKYAGIQCSLLRKLWDLTLYEPLEKLPPIISYHRIQKCNRKKNMVDVKIKENQIKIICDYENILEGLNHTY